MSSPTYPGFRTGNPEQVTDLTATGAECGESGGKRRSGGLTISRRRSTKARINFEGLTRIASSSHASRVSPPPTCPKLGIQYCGSKHSRQGVACDASDPASSRQHRAETVKDGVRQHIEPPEPYGFAGQPSKSISALSRSLPTKSAHAVVKAKIQDKGWSASIMSWNGQ